jgi:hypothetical protein
MNVKINNMIDPLYNKNDDIMITFAEICIETYSMMAM